MTNVLLAQFSDGEKLTAAARAARNRNYRVLDAFTPFPVEEVTDLLDLPPSRIKYAMLIGGFAAAALAYAVEYYSAAIAYPYNAGGRPLDAWPAFMLVPFAVGILVASICGVGTFLFETGLPCLHYPLFDAQGFDRVSQDAFVLALVRPETADSRNDVMTLLRKADAQLVEELEL
jgi:hypothetical protein